MYQRSIARFNGNSLRFLFVPTLEWELKNKGINLGDSTQCNLLTANGYGYFLFFDVLKENEGGSYEYVSSDQIAQRTKIYKDPYIPKEENLEKTVQLKLSIFGWSTRRVVYSNITTCKAKGLVLPVNSDGEHNVTTTSIDRLYIKAIKKGLEEIHADCGL